MFKNIKWFDGLSWVSGYILEIMFKDGKKGYIKNTDRKKISHLFETLWNDHNIIGLTVYNIDEKVEDAKYRYLG